MPAGSTAACAAWLAGLPGLIALHPAGDEMHDEITHVTAEVRRLIGRPAEKVYAGPCQAPTDEGVCPDHLYARPGAEQTRCHSCGAEHDVAERRVTMVDYAARLKVPASVALSWTWLLLLD